MNVSNDFCPFMCWSVYWCFVVKVSIPQESKNTTHETDFYSLPFTLYLKDVSLIKPATGLHISSILHILFDFVNVFWELWDG